MKDVPKKEYQVSALVGIAYALPVIPVVALTGSNNVLSGIYATHHGLALSAISMVMLIAGLFDAITDPAIGYFSDRYHARTGSRRPFVLAGAVLLIPSAWFLLNPDEGVTITYFLVWYLLFYLSMTLFHIPHMTWGGEISTVSEEKSKVFAYRSYAAYSGLIIFYLIPLLPFYEGTKITPETMRYLVAVGSVLLLPTLYMMLRYSPSGGYRPDQAKPENPFRALMALSHNKPMLWYMGATVLHSFALAFYIALQFMVMESYLGLGEYYVYLLLFHLVVVTLATKPAVKVIMRVGKIKSLMLAYLLAIPASMFMVLVLLNSSYSLLLMFVFNTVWAVVAAVANVAANSLLSDISDYGSYKSGVDRSATYFSIRSLEDKTCMAMGIALSIAIASWFGFDPKSQIQGPHVYWGLLICMCILPIIFNLFSVFCISKISITSRRHDVIRRRLNTRATRKFPLDSNPQKGLSPSLTNA
jgi:GPH family glycoside/pentoside/hexuronide:cation symporter